MNEGKMELWGVPENGSTPERLLKIDDDITAYQKSLSSGEFFFTMNGVNYRNLRIKRSSIKSYVDHVRRRGTEGSAAPEGKTDDIVKEQQSSRERWF
ncbi:hypothetical protein [Litorivita sp. NS0012-18]|uniref:hypothetical protein n=1 Tax=Litorivita sp. NS0012-18 TaxID=3127655 RepID=UPI003340F611